MHIDLNFNDDMIAGFRRNLERFGLLGIHAHITELDIKCVPDTSGQKCATEWTDELREKQADIYQKILNVCLDEPNCNSFETWGFTDRYSWLFQGANGLLMSENLQKKPAYNKLLDTLNKWNGTSINPEFMQ